MAAYVIKKNRKEVMSKKRIDHAKAEFGKLKTTLVAGDVIVLVGDGRILEHFKCDGNGNGEGEPTKMDPEAKAEAEAERIALQQEEDDAEPTPGEEGSASGDEEGTGTEESSIEGKAEDLEPSEVKTKVKPPKEKKAPKEKKEKVTRDVGDAVAIALRGLEVKQIATIAEAMLEEVELTDNKEKKAKESIKQAKHRAAGTGGYERPNPGSARMSLGLIIRTFNKQLNFTTAKLRTLAGV